MNDGSSYDITLFYDSRGISFSRYNGDGTNTAFFSIRGN